MKVVSVVGARPQFVKAFPTSSALEARHDEVLVHTGQHYDEKLSEVFFEELPLRRPDYNLGVGSETHADQTAAMLSGVDSVIDDEAPDAVLVYGDTNSTLAGALAGAKRDLVVAHVEAGLRSGDRSMPEEVNRRLTDHASDLLFAPSELAVETLREEGVTDGVHLTGDVMYDALLRVRDRVLHRTSRPVPGFDLADGEYVLATVHRARNTDDRSRLRRILQGLSAVEDPVVWPVHPRASEAIAEFDLSDHVGETLHLVDPLGYLEFVRALDGARVVATDSGGVQKEAFYLDTPCVTLRDRTEWPETVEAGWNRLVDVHPERIATAVAESERPASKPGLYGGGGAAGRIAEVLSDVG